MKYNKLEVNLKALRTNIKTALKIIGKNNFFYPFVKSNAYGVGIHEVTRILTEEGLHEVGLLTSEEARSLNSKKVQILIFGPIEKSEEFLSNPHWTPIISSFDDLNIFSQTIMNNKSSHNIHIKFDVGMSRLGFDSKDTDELISFFKTNTHLKLQGVCAHLSRGEDIGIPNSSAGKQIEQFKKIGKEIKKHIPSIKQHLLNSSALLGSFCHDLDIEYGSRLGGFIYGIKHDIENQTQTALKKWSQLDLQPVTTLKAGVLSSRVISQGCGVSYDSLWKAKTDSNIAVISMGYADGISRNLTGMDVLFRGQRVPIVGAVCMNFFMIDLTPVLGLKEKPKRGEEIVIYGKQQNQEITIKEHAQALGSIPYEVMTHISPSVQRVYYDL
ncbi:MAG: alanine racemase [Bdellovibrionales bacterium]|nr:alanine racemase [Bdellovibrionales bacterium]